MGDLATINGRLQQIASIFSSLPCHRLQFAQQWYHVHWKCATFHFT